MGTVFDSVQLPGSQSNIIDNGGFEIWQRGTSFTNFVGYHADRWQISTSCTVYTVAQESGAANIDSGIYSARCTITTAAGGVFRIGQSPENPAQYVGKTMTYSARIKSNVAGVKLFVSYIGGQTASTIAHTGDNTWQTISMTIVMPNAGLTFSIGFDSVNTTVGSSVSPSAGTFYVDGVSMVAGSNVPVYIPIPLQQDLARCQRFFVRMGGFSAIDVYGTAHCQSTTACYAVMRLPVQMRATPTLTINNQTGFGVYTAGGSNNPCTTVGASTLTPQSIMVNANVASGLVAGNATILYATVNTAYIDISADL